MEVPPRQGRAFSWHCVIRFDRIRGEFTSGDLGRRRTMGSTLDRLHSTQERFLLSRHSYHDGVGWSARGRIRCVLQLRREWPRENLISLCMIWPYGRATCPSLLMLVYAQHGASNPHEVCPYVPTIHHTSTTVSPSTARTRRDFFQTKPGPHYSFAVPIAFTHASTSPQPLGLTCPPAARPTHDPWPPPSARGLVIDGAAVGAEAAEARGGHSARVGAPRSAWQRAVVSRLSRGGERMVRR